jgi:hypothetical protein
MRPDPPARISARARRRRRRTRRLIVPIALAVVVVAALVVQSGADPAPTIPKSAVRIAIGAAPAGRPLAPGFIGFSIEYPSMIAYAGRNPASPNPTFLQLVRDLNPNQSPVLRFGGDTADWTWWSTPGVAKPGGIRYTLNRHWAQVTGATARALGARLILGVNFESDSRAIAGTEARALLDGIGRRYIAGFELGNEPEVYGSLGWYSTPAGVPVPGRPAAYGFASFLADYARVSAALPRGVPLVGPASGSPAWLTGVSQYLAANPRVGQVTFHRYPLHRCFTPRDASTYPTIANLLSPVAATGPATSLASAVAVAHGRGVPFRADELNSVSCGGGRGVSDTFASSLWILDTLFNMAKVGVDGVNVHTFKQAIYEPFGFYRADGHWRAQVKPMYYGLLMFARAAPPGSRLLPTSGDGPSTLRTWATRGPRGRVRVVLINDSRRHAVTVAVGAPGSVAAATLERLRAPRIGSKGDVTIAGQTFGPSTTTGRLAGPLRDSSLTPIRNHFVVRLPAASAALLTLAGP